MFPNAVYPNPKQVNAVKWTLYKAKAAMAATAPKTPATPVALAAAPVKAVTEAEALVTVV